MYLFKQSRIASGGRGVTPPNNVYQSANEASKVLEQGLAQNKFAVGKPRAMGLPTGFANI